jgi:hypothetical protein
MPDPALYYRGPYMAQAFPPVWSAPPAMGLPGSYMEGRPHPQPYQTPSQGQTPSTPTNSQHPHGSSGHETYPHFAGENPWPNNPRNPGGVQTPDSGIATGQTPDSRFGGYWTQDPNSGAPCTGGSAKSPPGLSVDGPGFPTPLQDGVTDPSRTSGAEKGSGGEDERIYAAQNPLKDFPDSLEGEPDVGTKAAWSRMERLNLGDSTGIPPMAFSSADLPHQTRQPFVGGCVTFASSVCCILCFCEACLAEIKLLLIRV